MGTLYKLNHTGHGEVSWNDKKAEQIRSFDPSVEHIVMIPNFVGG